MHPPAAQNQSKSIARARNVAPKLISAPLLSIKVVYFTAEHAEIAERTIRIKSISALSAPSAVNSRLFIVSGVQKRHEGLLR
jgi:hypothetical protein